MKVRIKRENILNKLTYLETIISEKSPKEILSHILFEAENNAVTLTVTNLESELKCNVDCEVMESGNISILSRVFSHIVKHLPENSEITIQSNKMNKVTISSKKQHSFKTETQGFTKEDFPKPPDMEFKNHSHFRSRY